MSYEKEYNSYDYEKEQEARYERDLAEDQDAEIFAWFNADNIFKEEF